MIVRVYRIRHSKCHPLRLTFLLRLAATQFDDPCWNGRFAWMRSGRSLTDLTNSCSNVGIARPTARLNPGLTPQTSAGCYLFLSNGQKWEDGRPQRISSTIRRIRSSARWEKMLPFRVTVLCDLTHKSVRFLVQGVDCGVALMNIDDLEDCFVYAETSISKTVVTIEPYPLPT